MLGWSGLVFYDEDDNFRDKDWILTSYDNSRKEDKIERARLYLIDLIVLMIRTQRDAIP